MALPVGHTVFQVVVCSLALITSSTSATIILTYFARLPNNKKNLLTRQDKIKVMITIFTMPIILTTQTPMATMLTIIIRQANMLVCSMLLVVFSQVGAAIINTGCFFLLVPPKFGYVQIPL